MHTLMIRFESENELVRWFEETRRQGLLEQHAGVRRQDALDGGRSHPGACVVSSEPGVGGYVTAPAATEADEAAAGARASGATREQGGRPA
jgi:hypothetical protein